MAGMTLATGPVLSGCAGPLRTGHAPFACFGNLDQCSLQREQHGFSVSLRFQILSQEDFILLLRQGPNCPPSCKQGSGMYHLLSAADIIRISSLALFRCARGAFFDSRIGRSRNPRCRKVLPKRHVDSLRVVDFRVNVFTRTKLGSNSRRQSPPLWTL